MNSYRIWCMTEFGIDYATGWLFKTKKEALAKARELTECARAARNVIECQYHVRRSTLKPSLPGLKPLAKLKKPCYKP